MHTCTKPHAAVNCPSVVPPLDPVERTVSLLREEERRGEGWGWGVARETEKGRDTMGK